MLPMAPERAREIALDYHLTLEVLRTGLGNQYHIGSMAQAIYMTMLLSQPEDKVARSELFHDAEEAILRCRKTGIETGVWVADNEAYALLGKILTLFDQQLATVIVYELMKANERLKKIFSSKNVMRDSRVKTS